MKGRKPKVENVVPFKEGGETRSMEERAAEAAKLHRSPFFNESQAAIWDEIAPELFKLGRLKPHFRHVAQEYVMALDRLRTIRADLFIEGDTYETKGRNGVQVKSRPEVAQQNETWRQWRALANDLGLSPAAERGLSSEMSDLFDDPANEFLGR